MTEPEQTDEELALEERIISWLGGRRHVADHVELRMARDRARQRLEAEHIVTPAAEVTASPRYRRTG